MLTGCSLLDQHILSPINLKYVQRLILSDLRRFTQIVLKFKTQVLQVWNFRRISVNLRKSDKSEIRRHILD